ncbi:MAG: glycosyltransferase family 4 protein [Methanoregulaceae archaeon]|nr:glycosyltransferase family 4 protein [Methanoregulaceae archaeon]
MKVNFFVEDMLFFKYIGCATVAKTLYLELAASPELAVSWKGYHPHADLVHYHTFGPVALLHKRLVTGKRVLTAHSTPRINNGNIALARTINRQYPRIYRKFDHIITISRPCHEEVTRMVPDMPVTLIPNGVDRTRFSHDPARRAAFREEFGIGEDEKVALVVAQLTPRKGLYDFFSLARASPDTRFVWVGGFPYGALSKDYRKIRFSRQKCGDNVIFTGHVRNITDAYCGADVFLMPSYAETFGLVILEALSCGLPVIARDIPEFRDIFGGSILYFTGIGDVVRHLEGDRELSMMASSARRSTEPFDIARIAKEHLALYRSLVES